MHHLGLVFLIAYFTLFAVAFLFFVMGKKKVAAICGLCVAAMFYGFVGMGIAQASTMSICRAEGIVHGPQAAATCRAHLRIYKAQRVINSCRTKVFEAEHKVFDKSGYHKVRLPKECVGFTLMTTRLAGANYVHVPAQIKLAPYSKVLDVQKPVPLTRYHSSSSAINY